MVSPEALRVVGDQPTPCSFSLGMAMFSVILFLYKASTLVLSGGLLKTRTEQVFLGKVAADDEGAYARGMFSDVSENCCWLAELLIVKLM